MLFCGVNIGFCANCPFWVISLMDFRVRVSRSHRQPQLWNQPFHRSTKYSHRSIRRNGERSTIYYISFVFFLMWPQCTLSLLVCMASPIAHFSGVEWNVVINTVWITVRSHNVNPDSCRIELSLMMLPFRSNLYTPGYFTAGHKMVTF